MPRLSSGIETNSYNVGTISRREVLAGLGAGALSAVLPRSLFASRTATVPTREEVETLLKPRFVTSDPAMFRFAVDVYQHCILGHVKPPEPPFKHSWLIPGGGFVGQWLWDTIFITDLLAILPDQEELLRGIYQNYWDFQKRWSAVKPDYAQGMIANFIAPDSGPKGFSGRTWRTFPAFSQAPLLAWGVKRVFLRNRDKELARAALPHLEKFHDWYWRERDIDNIGLVTVGSYDGVVQDARYETYDNEVDLDTLRLIPHPGRPVGPNNGPWYGDIYIPANTAYLLLSERSLIDLADQVGDHALAARRLPRLRKGIAAMRRHMWDDSKGCFLAVRRPAVHGNDLRKVTPATIGGMVPLQAGIPTRAQAARMAQVLATAQWNTPLPLPTVDRNAPEYRSNSYWRGDVWPSTDFQTFQGLAHYGYRKLTADFSGRMLDNAVKVGISEHYDSQTGAPLGVRNLGMSGVMLTMALEGMSPRHAIRVKAS